ncbi:MAG TPA: hypothetical protein VFI64_04210, partial [Nitrososphaeraceae archaeon]|nr:hypothetical protein [Nitrososphaeraceae archaeon]
VLKRSKYSHANESYEWDRTQEYLLVTPVLPIHVNLNLMMHRINWYSIDSVKVFFSIIASGRAGL